jgi:hypothetical protein
MNGEQSAFPIGSAQTPQRGLTIRDYIAIVAMQGNLAAQSQEWGTYAATRTTRRILAEMSYQMADAMIAAREAESTPKGYTEAEVQRVLQATGASASTIGNALHQLRRLREEA